MKHLPRTTNKQIFLACWGVLQNDNDDNPLQQARSLIAVDHQEGLWDNALLQHALSLPHAVDQGGAAGRY